MGDHCAVAAAGTVGRTAAHGRAARGHGCHSVHRVQRVPVADAPQGFPTEVHRAGLLLRDTVGEFAGLAESNTYAGKSARIVASIRTETGSLSFLAQP